MARQIAVGIDVGTHQVKVVVAEWLPEKSGRDREFPKIIGTGSAESRGLRHGYIINTSDTTESIKNAIAKAEASSGIKIKRAFISVGGIGLEAAIGSGNILISRGDNEVAAPLSGSLVSLAKTQKMGGSVLANIGAETVSIIVFENSPPISLEIFP